MHKDLYLERLADLAQNLQLKQLNACEQIASSTRHLLKAIELLNKSTRPFDITCDLEDGAAVGHETETLNEIIKIVSAAQLNKGRLGLRVHAFQSSFFVNELDQAIAQLSPKISYITIPKLTSARELQDISLQLDQLEQRYSKSYKMKLHILIETHQALHEVWQIAAHPRVETLDFGIMDFISAHSGAIPASAMYSPEQFNHPLVARAKLAIAAAALAHGKVASHNVTLDYSSYQQTFSDASQATREFGFQRMWSIHPEQITAIQDAMQPGFTELSLAVEVVIKAAANNWAPLAIDGRLYDFASYRYYAQVLLKAKANHLELPEEVSSILQQLAPT